MMTFLILLLAVSPLIDAAFLTRDTCTMSSNDVTIEPNADAMFAGLFDLRNPGTDGFGCGVPNAWTMSSYDAVLWALHRINKDSGDLNSKPITDSYVPGIKIGMKVYDTCGRSDISERAVLDVIPNLYSNKRNCIQNKKEIFLGVLSATSSSETVATENILKSHKIPHISSASTLTELSDKEKYPYFMRTIPPNSAQAKVVMEMLKKIKWKMIGIVYTKNRYGEDMRAQILKLSLEASICVKVAIPVDPFEKDKDKLRSVFNRLIENKIVGVLYLGSENPAGELMKIGSTVANAGKLQWAFTETVGTSIDFAKISNYTRGFLVVSSSSRRTPEFQAHWIALDENNPPKNNPWYQDWYMYSHNCKLAGVTYEPYKNLPQCPTLSEQEQRLEYVQNQYVLPAIDAVYTFASALLNAQKKKCNNVRGTCPALADMTTSEFLQNYLRKVDITYGNPERVYSWSSYLEVPYNNPKKTSFDNNGDVNKPIYHIWNYRKNSAKAVDKYFIERVGYFSNNVLTLDVKDITMYDETRTVPLGNIPESICPSTGCELCLTLQGSSRYMVIPGDIMINGVFSVHKSADGKACSTVMKNGAQLMEAFAYAVEKMSSTLRGGIKIGAVGIDDCNSGTAGSALITSFHNKMLKIQHSNGFSVQPENVYAYVAAHDSATTLSIADIITPLRMTQVGYRATNTELSDINQYPYFLRTVPSDAKQAMAIVKTLKSQGWTYVQTVQAATNYGRGGVDAFIKAAEQNGICVRATFEFGTDGTCTEILQKIRLRSDAKVIIVYAEPTEYKCLLKAIQILKLGGKVMIFGSDTWGSSVDVVNGYEDIAVGTFSVSLRSPLLTNFIKHLQDVEVKKYTINPWYVEWFESMFNCYISAQSQSLYTLPCNLSKKIPESLSFGNKQDPFVLYVVNAVGAIVNGIDRTLRDLCGNGYTSVCPAFTIANGRSNLLYENIKKAQFTDDLGAVFKFSERQGFGEYEIYNYQGKKAGYKKLGVYSFESDKLNLNILDIKYNMDIPITSRCIGGSACSTCVSRLKTKFLHIPGELMIGGLFNIHWTGNSAYRCGAIKKMNGFQLTEAFSYAIDTINKGNAGVKLNNILLGGVGLDDCSSEFVGTNIVSNVLSGSLKLQDKDRTINPKSIYSWITYGSYKSAKINAILSQLTLSQVSPSATSEELSNEVAYPTLYRTVPPDSSQAETMALFIKAMGWKCAQVVYSPNVYGKSGAIEFQKAVKSQQICLSSCLVLEGNDGNYDQIIEKLTKGSTKIVVVFANADQYVRQLLDAKVKNNNARDLVFIGSESWGQLKNIISDRIVAAENTFTLKIVSPVIQSFDDYLKTKFFGKNKRNPWFDEYFQVMFNCIADKNCSDTTPISNHRNYEQENFLVSTIDAVYASAEAMHLTLDALCGKGYSGICPNFIGSPDINAKITENLGKVDFNSISGKRFVFDARAGNKGYEIARIVSGAYVKVAQYIDKRFKLTDTSVVSAYSSYANTCSPCEGCKLSQTSKENEKFTYYPGDLLIAGIIDVSTPGAQPFSCGKINNKYGFLLTEAFNFALEQVQKKEGIFSGKLRGVNLGGITLDSCKSSIRASNLVADLNSGLITLNKGKTNILPSKILAYIAGQNTVASEEVGKVLRILNIPHVSYGATGLSLANKADYPFFLRTVPADDKLARAIVSFLKYWNFENVQVVSSYGPYSTAASKEVVKLAKKNGICITKKIDFKEDESASESSAKTVISQILKNPQASVIITILESSFLKVFLKAVDNDQYANKNFFYIGSESWGNDDEFLQLNLQSDVLKRVVTFDIETADIPEFDRYLDKKTPSNSNHNPWLQSYYEYIFQCSLPGNIQSYPKICSSTSLSIPRHSTYRQDPYTLYVVNAVYSVALALDRTLKRICGDDYVGVCEDFRQSGETRLELFSESRNVNFTDYTFQPFYFEGSGQSSRGYHAYAIRKNSLNTMEYYNIGSYNDTNRLKLDITYSPKWYSNCSNPAGVCDVCPDLLPSLSRYMQWQTQRDVSLVAFFDVHESGNNHLKCGAMRVTYGFQNMLAFFYAIDIVNKNYLSRFQSTIKMSGLAIDVCKREDRLRQDLFTYLDGHGLCHYAPYTAMVKPWSTVAYLTMESTYSTIAGKFLASRQLTHISPVSSSMLLSDKEKYPYLLRTVPPDNLQAQAMADILQLYDWSLFMAINSDNDYGNGGITALIDIINKNNATLCLEKRQIISLTASLEDAKNALKELNKLTHAKVVVLFCTKEHVRLILKAARELNLFGRFIWFGSDAWGNDDNLIKGTEEIARGSLTLMVKSPVVNGFIAWLKEISFTNRKGIPNDWFEEYWQHIHQCRLESSIVSQLQYLKACTGTESMSNAMITYDPSTLQIIIAVFMVAKGVTSIPECVGLETDYCLWRVRNDIKHKLIYNSVSFSQWQVLPDDLGKDSFNFKFTDQGYGDIGYTVYNLRIDEKTGKFNYAQVGRWNKVLDMKREASYEGYTQGGQILKDIPKSVCPAKVDCGCGGRSGRAQRFSYVLPAPGKTDNFNSVWGSIVTVVAAIGFLVTFCLFIYFLFFFPIRGGTTSLGYLLLIGIMMVYAVTLAFVFNPCPIVCCLRRFCLGISYAVCFSCMLVKVMNTWRVESYDKLTVASYRRLTHPLGLLLITLGISFVQVIIAIEWLTLQYPASENVIYLGQYWPRCSPSDFHNEQLLLSLVYVMFLVFLTTVFAALTWKSEESNRESRWILVSCCFTIGIWVLWTMVSTKTQLKYRDGAIAVGNLFCATVMLLSIYIRKIHYLRKYREAVAEQKAATKELEEEIYSSIINHKLALSSQISLNEDKESGYR